MSIFQVFLTIHIIAGSVCLLFGLLAASARKKRGKHTWLGEIYHGSYVIVFITAIVTSIMHWEESAHLFYIALFSYGLALFGYLARKQRWKNWLLKHIIGMLSSYIGILTAVLVTNGPNIPLLKEMPDLLFWFLPTIIGSPIVAIVTSKYANRKSVQH